MSASPVSRLAAAWALHRGRAVERIAARADDAQKETLRGLVRRAARTAFGRHHAFEEIRAPAGFAARVPVRDYVERPPSRPPPSSS